MSKAMSMCDMHFDTTPVASHAVQDGASSPMPDVAAESDAVARGPERRNAHHLSLMSHLSVCGARRIPNRLRVSYVRILLLQIAASAVCCNVDRLGPRPAVTSRRATDLVE